MFRSAAPSAWRRASAGPRPKREDFYVDAEKSEVPQAAARPPSRQGLARRRVVVWRLRPESARAGVDHRPPDRSLARGHYAVHETWRKAVDPHLSGQAVHQKAGGNPHG